MKEKRKKMIERMKDGRKSKGKRLKGKIRKGKVKIRSFEEIVLKFNS